MTDDSELLVQLGKQLASADWRQRRAGCRALAQCGDAGAVGLLVKHLEDSDSDVRRAACEALGDLAVPGAVPPLIDRLTDWHPEVRRVAASALGQLGDARVVGPLIQCLGDEYSNACEAACRALREIADALAPRATNMLCRTCLARFEQKAAKVTSAKGAGKARFFACRTCGKAGAAMFDVREVVAVLDREGGAEPVCADGTVRANWTARRAVFDLDRVEIVIASDDEVELFCIQVGNDTDLVRRPRYNNMKVTISPRCQLETSTINMLRRTFGTVVVGETETGAYEKGAV